MTDDNDTRIKRIKAKAEERGYDWPLFQKAAVDLNVAIGGIYKQGDWYATAELLLAVLAPGLVVEVAQELVHQDEEKQCNMARCNFWSCPWTIPNEDNDANDVPGPACPAKIHGTTKFKLIPIFEEEK